MDEQRNVRVDDVLPEHGPCDNERVDIMREGRVRVLEPNQFTVSGYVVRIGEGILGDVPPGRLGNDGGGGCRGPRQCRANPAANGNGKLDKTRHRAGGN